MKRKAESDLAHVVVKHPQRYLDRAPQVNKTTPGECGGLEPAVAYRAHSMKQVNTQKNVNCFLILFDNSQSPEMGTCFNVPGHL